MFGLVHGLTKKAQAAASCPGFQGFQALQLNQNEYFSDSS